MALCFVTIDMGNTPDSGNGTVTSRLRTDLKDRCSARTTWGENGSLEEVERQGRRRRPAEAVGEGARLGGAARRRTGRVHLDFRVVRRGEEGCGDPRRRPRTEGW